MSDPLYVFRRQFETWWGFNSGYVLLLVVLILAAFGVLLIFQNDAENNLQKQINICAGLADAGAETTMIEGRCFALSQSGDWYEVAPGCDRSGSTTVITVPLP